MNYNENNENSMEEKMSIMMVVPCYNEAEVLPLFMEEMGQVKKKLKRKLEILFINDGSSDNTLEMLREYSKEEGIYYLSFSRNFGKEAAMYAGLSHANAEYIGVMDADLQHDPIALLEMEKYLDEGYDVAATKRSSRLETSKFYNFGAGGFYKIINGLSDDIELEAGVQDFRMMKKNVVDAIVSLGEKSRFSKGIFSWVGFNIKYIEVADRPREAGTTKWSFSQSFRYAIDGIISFSISPLRIATYLGASISLLGFIYAIYVMVTTLTKGAQTAGFATIVCLILILGGFNLLFLGLIGEYIGRIYKETKDRPIYLIGEKNLKEDN